jgi:hypothetical protein
VANRRKVLHKRHNNENVILKSSFCDIKMTVVWHLLKDLCDNCTFIIPHVARHYLKDSYDTQQLCDKNEDYTKFKSYDQVKPLSHFNSVSLRVYIHESHRFHSFFVIVFFISKFLIHHSLFLRATLCFEFRTRFNFVIF